MEEPTIPKATEPEPTAAAPPPYEPPRVVSYCGREILDELGPAQACSFLHSVVLC